MKKAIEINGIDDEYAEVRIKLKGVPTYSHTRLLDEVDKLGGKTGLFWEETGISNMSLKGKTRWRDVPKVVKEAAKGLRNISDDE